MTAAPPDAKGLLRAAIDAGGSTLADAQYLDRAIERLMDADDFRDLVNGFGKIALFFLGALVITAALLFQYSRCLKSTLAPLACSIVAVIWQLGTLNLLGYGLGVFSVLVPFLVFAIAVSHGVQMFNAVAHGGKAGLEPEQGHRIIEIGCVEMLERRPTGNNFHVYLQPDREIDAAAVEVHGITNEFLADKPKFADIADDLMAYLKGAELIIHNAPFDVGFLDAELARLEGFGPIRDYSGVLDTLVMARKKHPGQRNSLDALCGRYEVDNSRRDKHGALLDAEILADVYLRMTGGQRTLSLDADISAENAAGGDGGIRRIDRDGLDLVVVRAGPEELAAHEERLAAIDRVSGAAAVWRRLSQ